MSGTAADTAYQARHRTLSDAQILAIDGEIEAAAKVLHAAGRNPTVAVLCKIVHRGGRLVFQRIEYLAEQNRWPYVRHTRSSPRLNGGRAPKADPPPKPKRTVNLDKMPLDELRAYVRGKQAKGQRWLKGMTAQS